jgi:alpha-tubulin suppressor-like RCC1 family protein
MTDLRGEKGWRVALWLLCCACGAQTTSEAEGGSAAAPHLATSATHSCAIREDGLYCWGRNASSELGDSSTTDSSAAARALAAGDAVVEVGTH